MGERTAAPVVDINRAPPKMSGTHVIKPGESLYEIAWRYNRDFVELAQVNGLKSPYHIKAGQKLSLSKPSAPSRTASKKTTESVKKSTPKTQAQKITPAKQASLPERFAWEWPTSGKIIQHFSNEKGQKGIDISGKTGQPVLAAAPGVVVYSGNGLRGYGELIIVKHNDEYLSAYAHNRQLFVKEGDSVKALQQIAEMGQTGTESTRLHFEIRRKGQPVNPLQFLPKQ